MPDTTPPRHRANGRARVLPRLGVFPTHRAARSRFDHVLDLALVEHTHHRYHPAETT